MAALVWDACLQFSCQAEGWAHTGCSEHPNCWAEDWVCTQQQFSALALVWGACLCFSCQAEAGRTHSMASMVGQLARVACLHRLARWLR